jgi:hypothetical protein
MGKRILANFQSLVDFRVDAGNLALINHCTSSRKNSTYRPKTIRNEMIDVLNDCITAKLGREVRDAGVFSVIADEKTDHANEEQLGVCLRFVGKESYNNNSTTLEIAKELTLAQLCADVLSINMFFQIQAMTSGRSL